MRRPVTNDRKMIAVRVSFHDKLYNVSESLRNTPDKSDEEISRANNVLKMFVTKQRSFLKTINTLF